MQKTLAIHHLPAAHNRGIGKAIVLWAAFESTLNEISYALLGVGRKGGRIAVREPRTHERIDMIRLLVDLRGVKLKNPQWESFRKDTEAAMMNRDLIAHGVWTRHPPTGQMVVRVITLRMQIEGESCSL